MQPSARAEYLCRRPRLGGPADFSLMTDLTSSLLPVPAPLPRRSFLRVAGASAATVGLVLAGCGKTDPQPVAASTTLSFGTDADTDRRVLNYLLFLKELEFAFYDKVIAAFPADLSAAEQAYFRDLRDHEQIHQQVLNNVLQVLNKVTTAPVQSALPFDFSTFTLTTRAGVLAAAAKLEDTAAGAFLGIIPRLLNNTLFTLTAKMASVEARHAALVRDLLTPGSFAGPDVLDAAPLQAGQALALTPTQVAAALAPFLPTLTINIDSLPTA